MLHLNKDPENDEISLLNKSCGAQLKGGAKKKGSKKSSKKTVKTVKKVSKKVSKKGSKKGSKKRINDWWCY